MAETAVGQFRIIRDTGEGGANMPRQLPTGAPQGMRLIVCTANCPERMTMYGRSSRSDRGAEV
jgi:hypothetical protein